eukprot:TRINITY_DN37172_c0_g1_i1.p1 TRINITY_DN37172_c0_g1~~TRINITY_DN37172_c0_g1_i1.p1  ORF type:complete len:239 (-),score=34.67 TRINITY_DN37172_c0_g1_i1:393-1109(-)
MRAGAPDPWFLQEAILKEQRFIDGWADEKAAGITWEMKKKAKPGLPREWRYLATVNKDHVPFQSTLTKKDHMLLKEFRNRPVAAKVQLNVPYANILDGHENTSYGDQFNCKRAPGLRASIPEGYRPQSSPAGSSAEAKKQMSASNSAPWIASYFTAPQGSLKRDFDLSATTFPDKVRMTLSASDFVKPQEKVLAVPYLDITSYDGRSSRCVRPHIGALVDGPLTKTSSFRKVSQMQHF